VGLIVVLPLVLLALATNRPGAYLVVVNLAPPVERAPAGLYCLGFSCLRLSRRQLVEQLCPLASIEIDYDPMTLTMHVELSTGFQPKKADKIPRNC
jgi:hypothetical protein